MRPRSSQPISLALSTHLSTHLSLSLSPSRPIAGLAKKRILEEHDAQAEVAQVGEYVTLVLEGVAPEAVAQVGLQGQGRLLLSRSKTLPFFSQTLSQTLSPTLCLSLFLRVPPSHSLSQPPPCPAAAGACARR